MTTEANEPQSFAEFEAQATAAQAEPVAEPEAVEPTAEVEEQVPDGEAKPLELTEEDELVEDGEEPEHKGRSKSAKQRIDELTKARREAERRVAELEQMLAGKPAHETPADIGEAPDPDKYEFGEADPQFIRDTISHGVKSALAEEKAAESAKANQAAATETLATLDNSWAEQAEAGAEKYDDFDAKVEDFKANAPCPPLMAIAIQASPVGADAVYHLANDQDEAHVIAALLEVGTPTSAAEAAERFGAIEGQYMTERPKHPGAQAHPLDKAIYAGRLKSYLANKGPAKPTGKVVTDAPEPPKHQVRGAGGRFETPADTTDFAAFEKMANARLSARR